MSFWGIVWVHLGTGGIWLNVMLLTPVFRRLGATMEEAARVAEPIHHGPAAHHLSGAVTDDHRDLPS